MGSLSPCSSRNWLSISGVASTGRKSAAGSPVRRDRKKTRTSRSASEKKLEMMREAYWGTAFLHGRRCPAARAGGGTAPAIASLEGDVRELELGVGRNRRGECDPLADPGEVDHVEEQDVGHHVVVDIGDQVRPQLRPLWPSRSRSLGNQLISLRVRDP